MSVFSPPSKFDDFVYRHFRFIHALKLGFALFIAALINAIWALPHFVWSMVTIVIIMMSLPQLGGALEKSLQRAVGTCLGSAYGVLLIATFHNYWVIMALLILAVSLICFISAGRYSYAYLVSGFTIIIVIGDANQATSEAIWRMTNILMGCLIAILVSLFVLPIKAKQDWRYQLAKSFATMANVLNAHFHHHKNDDIDNRKQLETIMKAVLTQKKLFFSLDWESQTLKHNKNLISQLAQEQVRAVTLLELLMQTHWNDDHSGFDKVNVIAEKLISNLSMLNEFTSGKREFLVPMQELKGLDFHEELLTALDLKEQQEFNLTGYTWVIDQLGKTIEAMYLEVNMINQAYIRKKEQDKLIIKLD